MNSISIQPEPGKVFAAQQQRDLVRTALAANPASDRLRFQLARLHNQLDEFDQTITVLTAVPDTALDYAAARALVKALLARGGPGDEDLAIAAAEQALVLATDDRERSTALADKAKVLSRTGQYHAAADLLHEALRLDPHNWPACKRLTVHLLERGDPDAVLAMTQALAAQGARYSRLLSARTVALARLGRIEEARAVTGLDQFLYREPLPVPAGWTNLEDFNADLAKELLAHPALRYGGYGIASENTWRIDDPATGTTPAIGALLAQIARMAERHGGSLPALSHPWVTARPANTMMRSWCVITGPDGFEDWHMHPLGWMSGTYYIKVPPGLAGRNDTAGCLVHGLPSGPRQAMPQFAQEVVRPQPGLLTLFPSHCYHRTFPHGQVGEQRICISFDILSEEGQF